MAPPWRLVLSYQNVYIYIYILVYTPHNQLGRRMEECRLLWGNLFGQTRPWPNYAENGIAVVIPWLVDFAPLFVQPHHFCLKNICEEITQATYPTSTSPFFLDVLVNLQRSSVAKTSKTHGPSPASTMRLTQDPLLFCEKKTKNSGNFTQKLGYKAYKNYAKNI